MVYAQRLVVFGYFSSETGARVLFMYPVGSYSFSNYRLNVRFTHVERDIREEISFR